MNVVDSSGWLEYFTGGPNAQVFAPPIQHVADLLVPTICMHEVFKRLLTAVGEESALQAVGVMTLELTPSTQLEWTIGPDGTLIGQALANSSICPFRQQDAAGGQPAMKVMWEGEVTEARRHGCDVDRSRQEKEACA